MERPTRRWHLTMIDIVVGLAVLMILTALVIPIFVPPEGRAASATAAPATSTKPARH